MFWVIIGASALGTIGGLISGILFGYAAILKAKAWLTWADRCDPKGTFHPPIAERDRSTSKRLNRE